MKALAIVPLIALTGCVTAPSGPTVTALPGNGKTFDQFRSDDAACRQYAQSQLGGATPEQAAVQSGVASAAVGTAIGAAAGALFGSRGATGVGAGAGLLIGSSVGSQNAYGAAANSQRRLDNAYTQCMYGSGDTVPVAGGASPRYAPVPTYGPPPGYLAPYPYGYPY